MENTPVYRILGQDEFYKAQALFEKMFPVLKYPSPEVSSIYVAEIDGEVAAMWVFQLCAHAEPVCVDPKYSGMIDLPKLLDTVHTTISDSGGAGMEYYIYTATPEWDRTLQANGFTPIGFAYKAVVP